MMGIDKMNVQIVTLGPMRVASIYAFGIDPRKDAFEKLLDWAGPQDFLNRKNEHPIFGFNNPGPRSGNARFGYELWMKVGAEIEQKGDLRIIEFNGGSYAVTRCKTSEEKYENMTTTWTNLAEWCKNNNYKSGYHQALEKFVTRGDKTDELILDLYYPVIY
jgi:DNA gyrase inhibitor GyrI